MSKEAVKVLGDWPSPFVMRAWIALNLKGVDDEFIQETMAPKSDILLKLNPIHKKFPVLVHVDRPVCEFLVIVQYIDDAWSSGYPIHSANPYNHATTWFPALSGIAKALNDERKKLFVEQVLEGARLLEEVYVKCSLGKPFIRGDQIGYLDIDFGCFLGWMKLSEGSLGIKILDEENVPGLAKWAESFYSDQAVKDVITEAEKLAEFAEVITVEFKATVATKN